MRKMIIIVIGCFSLNAFGIMQDYSPLAVGNWWEYQTKTGNQRYEIIEAIQDTFVFKIVTEQDGSQPATNKARVVSVDSLGLFYQERYVIGDHVLYSGVFGPHFALPVDDFLITPLDTFRQTSVFNIFRHGNGHVDDIVAPGVGVVARTDTYIGVTDTSALITGYHLQESPKGYDHIWQTANRVQDSLFQYTGIGRDSCEITFGVTSNACGKFMVLTSYHTLHNCLRVYLTDTTQSPCNGMVQHDHTIRVNSLDSRERHTVRVFKVWYEAHKLHTELLYDEQILPHSGVVVTKQTRMHGEGQLRYTRLRIYDVSGRVLQAISGHASVWNGVNTRQKVVRTGICVIAVKSQKGKLCQKFLLQK